MPRKVTHTGKPGAERAGFRPDVIETYHAAGGEKLLDFLIAAMPARKRTTVKELLKHSQVAVNGMPVTQFDTELQPDDRVEVNLTRAFKVFSNRRVKLVYEDDDIMVIEKGYGLLSMGTDKVKDGTAYSIMRDYVKWQDPRNKLFIVHRLDRDTSGLMMFAKTEEAQNVLRHNWNNMILERLYVAVLEGYLEQNEGFVKSRLAENSQFVVYTTENPEEGRVAVTHYEVIGRGCGYTLAQFSLDTGRKNQIRVHAKELGHPIAGDKKYGATKSPLHRLALHARTLRFAHPITRRDMNFETPIPPKFAAAIRRQMK